MDSASPPAILDLVRGQLRVRGWPHGVRPPFGLRSTGADRHGPPRLRWRVRQVLTDAKVPFVDQIATPAIRAERLPALPDPEPAVLPTWLAHGGRGIVVGLPEDERRDLVVGAVHRQRTRALVLVRDSGAGFAWTTSLRRCAPPEAFDVLTVSDAARTMHWHTRRHDLLVVDRPEQMPEGTLRAAIDSSAACCRLGLVDDARDGRVLDWSAGLGPVLAITTPLLGARRIELRVPLSRSERAEYARAWDMFLRAYDRFASLRPDAGFGTFVQKAREDPAQRDALLAWHRATRVAAWNASKAAAVADLLERHRGTRILVFTADRDSAYAISRAHGIAAVTAELRRSERDAALADFTAGRLCALVGPRLLDLGVPEGAAQVAVLAGGSFGRLQRSARCRRVAPGGVVYELVTEDTMEIGRARRFARADASPPAVGHDGVR